jgi:hypothetical protein
MKHFCGLLVLALGSAAAAHAAPAALLQPADKLSPEVLAAAQFDWKAAGLDYAGVWADTAASCAFIDSDTPYDGFRIITPTEVIAYASTCSIAQSVKTGDGFTLSGICQGEGESNPTTTVLHLIDDETIREDASDYTFTRCHLPD